MNLPIWYILNGKWEAGYIWMYQMPSQVYVIFFTEMSLYTQNGINE